MPEVGADLNIGHCKRQNWRLRKAATCGTEVRRKVVRCVLRAEECAQFRYRFTREEVATLDRPAAHVFGPGNSFAPKSRSATLARHEYGRRARAPGRRCRCRRWRRYSAPGQRARHLVLPSMLPRGPRPAEPWRERADRVKPMNRTRTVTGGAGKKHGRNIKKPTLPSPAVRAGRQICSAP